MNSISPNIPTVLPNLAWLEDLSLQEQGLFLLKRIVDSFGQVRRFWKEGLSWCMDGIDHFGLVPGLRNDEIRRGIDHLLDKPFDWNVRNGYFVARGPERDHFYAITAKALAVVDGLTHNGLTLEVDDESMDIIRSQNWYRFAPKHGTD